MAHVVSKINCIRQQCRQDIFEAQAILALQTTTELTLLQRNSPGSVRPEGSGGTSTLAMITAEPLTRFESSSGLRNTSGFLEGSHYPLEWSKTIWLNALTHPIGPTGVSLWMVTTEQDCKMGPFCFHNGCHAEPRYGNENKFLCPAVDTSIIIGSLAVW